MTSIPLVTIFLLSYNNERFIEEALNGVLSQTYHPLQVIISDDCSQDRSFNIIKEMVAEYRGPHEVVLNQNERNLGLGNNVNKVMELAEGEIIVESDGDDISFPNRVAETISTWMDAGKKYLVMCGESLVINEAGEYAYNLQKVKPMTFDKVLQSQGGQWVYGGSLAWHRSLFHTFGPLCEGVVSQDKAIGFRSLLLGQEIGYIDKPLIKYRSHSANVTSGSTTLEMLQQKISTFRSYLQDLDKAKSLGYLQDRDDIYNIYDEFVQIRDEFVLRHEILSSNILNSLIKLIKCGNKLSFQEKQKLLLKKLKGHEKKIGW